MTGLLEIAIFVLFHPQRLTVKPAPGHLLTVEAGRERLTLGGSRAVGLRLESGAIDWYAERQLHPGAPEVHFRGEMLVSVPGRLERRFHGGLRVRPAAGELLATLEVDLEEAVATAVEAESPPDAPLEARKAQAVVTRTWYLANRRRHGAYDFCDTTHCQVLKDPRPSPAAQATRGLVLLYQGRPFSASFSASCGGRTLTAAAIGWHTPPGEYPYFAVDCPVCQRNEPIWERTLEGEDLAAVRAAPGLDATRIAIGRRRGWDFLPGNAYTLTGDTVRGRGHGHGLGYCQRGGAGLGLPFDQILRHYFPNTLLSPAP